LTSFVKMIDLFILTIWLQLRVDGRQCWRARAALTGVIE